LIEISGVAAWRPILESYVVPSFQISTFSATAGTTKEIGQSVTTPAFTATYNQTPTTATLADTEGNPTENVISSPTSFASDYNFSKTANNATVTFTLSASNSSGSDTATVVMAWRPRTYYGIGAAGLSTEADIEGLPSSQLLSSRSLTFSVTSGSGDYIYWAAPNSYSTPTFTVGGFAGGFVLVGTVSVTNTYGVTQTYQLWKSVNDNLGSTTVVVS
jgi:hypothetical protein